MSKRLKTVILTIVLVLSLSITFYLYWLGEKRTNEMVLKARAKQEAEAAAYQDIN